VAQRQGLATAPASAWRSAWRRFPKTGPIWPPSRRPGRTCLKPSRRASWRWSTQPRRAAADASARAAASRACAQGAICARSLPGTMQVSPRAPFGRQRPYRSTLAHSGGTSAGGRPLKPVLGKGVLSPPEKGLGFGGSAHPKKGAGTVPQEVFTAQKKGRAAGLRWNVQGPFGTPSPVGASGRTPRGNARTAHGPPPSGRFVSYS